MPKRITIALTADIHWGIHDSGDAATRRLLAALTEQPPDVLVLAGDLGAGGDFEQCLKLFAELPCAKAVVPGNHDIWVTSDDTRGDSAKLYFEHLPALCATYQFNYLDHQPLLLPDADLAIVGTMSWYDYSWADDPNWPKPSDWRERLEEMRFTRGRHNDKRFVRWSFTNESFTARLVATLERQLVEALQQVGKVIVVTHHPAFEGLKYPEILPPHLDQMLWRAFSGNRSLERVLERHAERIAFVFSGHTHMSREGTFAGIRGYNIGGDYSWKRLLTLSWPDGALEAKEFHP